MGGIMRLKNKRTGEIGTLIVDGAYKFVTNFAVEDDERNRLGKYNSLAELNEEWEDYEELKQWYGLNAIRDVGFEPLEYEGFEDLYKHAKELGIAFETKEEAEKAVEKLKCFTNLKNHEFMFDGWYYGTDGNIVILANAHEFNDMEEQDLTKVFGEKIC